MPRESRETHSAEQTELLGQELAERLPEGGLVLLIGDLGAGKTTLVKGIAARRAACHPDEVTSPTFTLIQEYGYPVAVYHIDLYRLEHQAEVEALGIEELLESGALVVVEWGERFPALWPTNRCEVRLTHAGDDSRRIEIAFPQR